MVNDHFGGFELGCVNHFEDGVQVVSHSWVNLLQLAKCLLVHFRFSNSTGGHREAFCFEGSEVQILKMSDKVLLPLWHLLTISWVAIVNAEIDELFLHLVNDSLACSLVLFLKALRFSFPIKLISLNEILLGIGRLQQSRFLLLSRLLFYLALVWAPFVINLCCEATPLCILALKRLPCHVADQLHNLVFGFLSVSFVQEVLSDEGTNLDHGVRQESLEEVTQVLASLLQKGSLHVTYIFLFRETRSSFSAANVSLDLILELS